MTNETLFVIILHCVAIWCSILWWLVSWAVNDGVSELTNLMKKNLELKGVTKEEIDKICVAKSENSKKEILRYLVIAGLIVLMTFAIFLLLAFFVPSVYYGLK